MTNEDEALVERLRSIYRVKLPNYIDDAADRIEAQAAEIERLKRDHASVVAELNKTRALFKGYRRAFKNAKQKETDG